MKRIIVHLYIAHALTVIIALLTDAGLKTTLSVYAAQTAIFLITVHIDAIRLNRWPQKFAPILELLICFIIEAVIVAGLILTLQSETIFVNGVERPADFGNFSLFALIAGAVTFIINYYQSQFRNTIHKDIGSLNRGVLVFFRSFARLAGLLLIIVLAALFSSSAAGIIAIASMKFIIDVGSLAIDNAVLQLPTIPELVPRSTLRVKRKIKHS